MGSTYKRQGIGGGDTVGKAHVLAMQATFAADSLVVGIGSMAPPGCENLTDDYELGRKDRSPTSSGWLAQRGVMSIAVWRADIASLLYNEKGYCGVQRGRILILDSFRNGTAAALAAPRHIETPLPTTFWPPVAEIENFTVSPPGAFNVTGWGRDHHFGRPSRTPSSSHGAAARTGGRLGRRERQAEGAVGGHVVRLRAVRGAVPLRGGVHRHGRRASATRLTKLYGRRSSPKIWAFGWSARNHEVGGCGADPTPECKWTWGATEGWVWEYYPAQLGAGEVSIELTMSNATAAGATGPLADRSLDAVLLTNNLTDIKMRMANEQQLALDGLLSQHDEVFVKVTNKGSAPMRLDVPYEAYHSAYPSQHLICIPYCVPSADGKVYSRIAPLRIELAKGATSDWVEVGSLLDSFNDGTLTVTSNVSGAYSLAVGATVGSAAIKTIGTFSSKPSSPSIEVAISANTRATGWVRAVDDDLAPLAEATALDAVGGGAGDAFDADLWLLLLYEGKIRAVEPACYLEASTSASYKTNVAKFRALFPLSDTSANDAADPSIAG